MALLAVIVTGCKQGNVIELTYASEVIDKVKDVQHGGDFVEVNVAIKKHRVNGNVVTIIGKDKFTQIDRIYLHDGLEQIKLPSTIEKISSYAFDGCTSLKSIELPPSLMTIGRDVFRGCKSLQSCNIPENVTEIGVGIFNYCNNLTQITVSKGNKLFDSRDNCNAIISTSDNVLIAGCAKSKIPDSVTRIGESAFEGTSISNVKFPSSVLTIGERAFLGCRDLTHIEWSDNLSVIESDAFCDCDGITSLWFPQSLTEICNDAFCDCDGITSLYITDNVKKLSGFRECRNLKRAIIDASKVEYEAFSYCENLIKVVFQSNVSYIDKFTFNECPIEEVEIRTPRTAFSCDRMAGGYLVSAPLIWQHLSNIDMQKTITSISDYGFVIVRKDGIYFRNVDPDYDGDEV